MIIHEQIVANINAKSISETREHMGPGDTLGMHA